MDLKLYLMSVNPRHLLFFLMFRLPCLWPVVDFYSAFFPHLKPFWVSKSFPLCSCQKILLLDGDFFEWGLPAFIMLTRPRMWGLPANGLFIGATFLSGLTAKVPARGWSPALLARAPRIVGVPEMAVGWMKGRKADLSHHLARLGSSPPRDSPGTPACK